MSFFGGLRNALGMGHQQPQQPPTAGLGHAGQASAGLPPGAGYAAPAMNPAMNAPGHMNHGPAVQPNVGNAINQAGMAFHNGAQHMGQPVQYAPQAGPAQAQLQNNQAAHIGMGQRFRGLMGVM